MSEQESTCVDSEKLGTQSKPCTMCKIIKPLSEFYRRKGRRSKFKSACMACCRVDKKKWQRDNSNAISERRAKRLKTPESQERERTAKRAYDQRNRDRKNKRIKQFVADNPEKRAAQSKVSNAIRTGALVRPTVCQRCGKTDCRIEGSHDDYAKPFDVEWLCVRCHRIKDMVLGGHRFGKPLSAKMIAEAAIQQAKSCPPDTSRTDALALIQALWTEIDEEADRLLANDLSAGAAGCLAWRDRLDEIAAKLGQQAKQPDASKTGIYVASRVKHARVWQGFRNEGLPIISTWIDEANEGDTADIAELWTRIESEIRQCSALVFYAGPADVPLKGAYIEAGMALAMGKPVFAVIDMMLEPRSMRPIGSWLNHPNVRRVETVAKALADASKAGGL